MVGATVLCASTLIRTLRVRVSSRDERIDDSIVLHPAVETRKKPPLFERVQNHQDCALVPKCQELSPRSSVFRKRFEEAFERQTLCFGEHRLGREAQHYFGELTECHSAVARNPSRKATIDCVTGKLSIDPLDTRKAATIVAPVKCVD